MPSSQKNSVEIGKGQKSRKMQKQRGTFYAFLQYTLIHIKLNVFIIVTASVLHQHCSLSSQTENGFIL